MQRNISFDIIRIFAILLIITYHFNVIDGIVFSDHFGFIGNIIFFILSGYLLRMSFQRNPNIKTFYKKRYMSIFPLLIVTFIIFYFLYSLRIRNFFYGGPLWTIIFSFMGIDAYLVFFHLQFYHLTGEWFTTAILFLYTIFPLLYKIMKKNVWIPTIILAVLFYFTSYGTYTMVPEPARICSVTFAFWVGMLINWLSERIKFRFYYIIPLLIIIAIFRLNIDLINHHAWVRVTYATSIFLVLMIIFTPVHFNKKITDFLVYLSSIAYAVYLVHHRVIYYFVGLYGTVYDHGIKRVALYILVVLISVLAAAIVYEITNKIVNAITEIINKFRKKDNQKEVIKNN